MTASINLHTDNEKNTIKLDLRKNSLDSGETFFTLHIDIGETELNIFVDDITKLCKLSTDLDKNIIRVITGENEK